MTRNRVWVVSMVVGFGTGSCGGEHASPIPLETPPGEIQTAGVPTTVARLTDPSSGKSITDIAIAGNDLYVSVNWSGVYRLPKYGGSVTALEEGTNVIFGELASSNGAVFWVDNTFPTTHVRRVATGDDRMSTIYQSALGTFGESFAKNLQADDSLVYLTQPQDNQDTYAVHRIPSSGGAELSTIVPVSHVGPVAWVVRNGSVFFAECAGDHSCAIQRVTGDDTQTVATIAADRAWVRGVDDMGVYVVTLANVLDYAASQPLPLLRVDQQTGAVVELLPDSGGAYGLLTDDREIFFVGLIGSAIAIDALPKQGGALRTVADLSTITHGWGNMVQDNAYLFLETVEGNVFGIPKGTPAQP